MDFPTLESFNRSTAYWRGGGQLPHQQKSRGAWSVWPRKVIFAAKRRKTNSRRILESFLPSLHFFHENSVRQEKCGSWPPPLSSQTIKTLSYWSCKCSRWSQAGVHVIYPLVTLVNHYISLAWWLTFIRLDTEEIIDECSDWVKSFPYLR